MNVNVRLFASLHELVGARRLSVEVPDGASVRTLHRELERLYPTLTDCLPTVVSAINEEYVDGDETLRDGDEVALIPPVSGGSATLGPFEVTSEPLDAERLVNAVRRDDAGALVLFHGVARNNADGRRVVALEYDAYPSMAERKLREVAEDIAGSWSITAIGIFHRTGRLEIGEASLLVAVSSAHRKEAFEACHAAVDRIKQVVPIWKKEIFEDGDGEWVAGHIVDVAERAPSARG